MPTTKPPQPKVTVSIRITPELAEAFKVFVDDFNRSLFKPDGQLEVLSETQAYREALRLGLAVLQSKLLPKRGGRK